MVTSDVKIQPDQDRSRDIWRVVAMALPVVITTSSRALMDFTDFVMISKLDLHSQAAILPSQIIMWSYIVLGLGVVSLVNTYSAQALGAKRYADCSAYAWQGLYISAIVGIVGLFVRPVVPELIALFAHDPEVQVRELAYTNVALLTVFPTVGAGALGWFFIGIHRPWVTTYSVIEANIVNIVVSLILIFGLWGAPRLEIAGAAWGTLAGVSYRMVRLTVTLVLPSVDRVYHSRSTWYPQKHMMLSLLKRGVPAGIQWVSEVAVWGLFINIMIGKKFGTTHLVASNIAWQYMRISFMPAIGVAQSLTALVGRSLGEGDPDRAMRYAKLAARLTLVYMGTLSLIYLIGRREFIASFNEMDAIVSVGAQIMICAAAFQLFDALGIVYDGALRGAGDTFVPAIYHVCTSWFFLFALAWWVGETFPEWGAVGPWITATLLIAATAVFVTWRWHSRRWLAIDILGKKQAEQRKIETANASAGS
ncbi:MAG: MATE family efflux transporter [Phycisphaerae bacterium]